MAKILSEIQIERRISCLKSAVKYLYPRLECCDICPRKCRVNRIAGEIGYCGTGKNLLVYTAFLHKGEEPPLSKGKGSGTVFFSGCNLKCLYCQNYKFSHSLEGKVLNEEDLAKIALGLQNKGANNINLVTPTHFLPQILKSLLIACENGLKIPIVYNTSGFEQKEIIKKLDGIIDVYLTDLKYRDPLVSGRYSKAKDYFQYSQESIKEMYCQKKIVLESDANSLSEGLIIRHLLLPGHLEESKQILTWIKENASEALLSLMFQYRPYFQASKFPEINRRVTIDEYNKIKDFLKDLDMRGWVQELNSNTDLAGVYFSTSSLEEFI